MNAIRLATLKFFALLFLLPGLAGLIVSAMVSTHYLDTLPRSSMLDENRFVPRGIHGIVVYQTPRENHNLNLLEFSSVGVFTVGLVLGVAYLEKWGSAQASSSEEDSKLIKHTL